MKTTDTISVNPSKATLGRVHEEAVEKLIRASVIERTGTKAARSEVISIVFPGTKSGLKQFRNYSLPLRTLFATILIVSGLTIVQGNAIGYNSLGTGIVEMVAGALLAIGLLTRPVMLLASIFFGIAGAIGMRNGITDLNLFSLMFGSAIFASIGSGKYSFDTMIRSALCRNFRRKIIDKSMGYKAFQYATKSI